MATLHTAVLLERHRPVVQYDSLESYYADWAAVITDRPGNLLKRADGTVLAVAPGPGVDTQGKPALELGFLGTTQYADGEQALPTDYLDESGKDYVADAREMHARPEYADRVHGRCVECDGITWLQYWFFMYYDDPGILDFGTHEGDIEMIQIRLAADGSPEAVSYSQHRSGVSARWDQVETDGDAPIVYSARGSHASMLRVGTSYSLGRSAIPDHNDGQGPRRRLELVTISERATSWALWPGIWGSTRADHRLLDRYGLEANSPTCVTGRVQWNHPAAFHEQCEPTELPPPGMAQALDTPAPATPQLTVRMQDDKAVIDYTLPDGPAAPTNVVIGVEDSGGQLPPRTTVVPVDGRTGAIELPAPPTDQPVTVRATSHAEDGTVSRTAQATL